MTEATQSWLEMLKKFGSDLNLPKVDVDKLIEMHRKNLDAVEQSAQVASAGAKSLADKQREIIETAFREAAAMARDFKPTGDPKEVLAKQTRKRHSTSRFRTPATLPNLQPRRPPTHRKSSATDCGKA